MVKKRQKTTNSLAYRLEYAMMERGLRGCDICEKSRMLGFPMGSSTISQYLSGKYEPKHDKVVLLSRILGVPELWLMGVTPFEDIAGNKIQDYANPMEAEVLSNFRTLNDKGKELLICLLRTIANTTEYKK